MESGPEIELEAKDWTGYHTFLTIYLAIVTFFGLFGVVYTGLIIPKIMSSFDWDDSAMLTIFAITGAAGLFTVIPRFLADRYGRKPCLLIFTLISFSLVIGSNLAEDALPFVLLRFSAGFFGINLSAVIMSEEVPARHRGKAFGVITGIGMTSSLLAAYLFTYTELSEDMWRLLYNVVFISGLILISVFWFKLKETRRFTQSRINNQPKQSLFVVFSRKYIKILFLSGLLLFFTTWIYLTIKFFFTRFLELERSALNLTAEIIGTWMIFIYIGSIIGYYFSGYLADKIGRKKSVYLTASIYFIGSLIFLNTWNVTLIFISLFILNVSFAIFRLIADILAVEFFQTDIRAVGSGWVFAFAAIANVLGIFILRFLREMLGSYGITFLIIGTSCLIALVIMTFFIPETKQRVVEEIYMTEIEKGEV
ncbi:MAG: MFS transporter [Candidatus Helarchaeota archaeon]|nr:MFS transporter [Candidatus Helarchaeota archaeon]